MKRIHLPLLLTLASAALLPACDDPLAPDIPEPLEPTLAPPVVRPSFAVQRSVEVIDLGRLGTGPLHVARDINNRGQVVGISSDDQGQPRAFLWTRDRGMVDLGTTGGASASALGISQNGVVVGMSLDASGAPEAALWAADGTVRGLGRFGGLESVAFGVNDRGQVVGRYTPMFDPFDPSTFRGVQAFLWDPGRGFQELPTLGNPFEGYAWAINNSGWVIGSSSESVDPTAPYLAYVWSEGSGISNVGVLSPDFSEHDAFSINDRGGIAGGAYNEVDGTFHPFVRTPSRGLIDLKMFGFPADASAFALDINIFGHVAALILNADGTNTPAVWIRGVGVVEFPTLGGVDGEIWAINDLGVLAGWSQTASGEMRAALWRLVFSAEDRIRDVITTIEEILPTITDDKVAHELEEAVEELEEALEELAESPPDIKDAVKKIEKAAKEIEKAIKKGLDPSIGTALLQVLAEVTRDLAVEAINDAIARGGDPREIAKAQDNLAEGDALRAAGEYVKAIKKYGKAAKEAAKA